MHVRRPPPLARLPAAAGIALVRVYQWCLSPWLGGQCRFQPTCSNYMIESIRKYGLWRGGARGLRRIGRCHPFHPGGHDPP